CKDKHCATLFFKRTTPWKDEWVGAVDMLNSNKGMMILHFGKEGYLELEALLYDKYPYKKEVKRVLGGNFSQPSEAEFALLDQYFKDLETADMDMILV
ncbi:MAG: hypothetical protein ACQESN_10605, partial [Thermotogota bacterium]